MKLIEITEVQTIVEKHIMLVPDAAFAKFVEDNLDLHGDALLDVFVDECGYEYNWLRSARECVENRIDKTQFVKEG